MSSSFKKKKKYFYEKNKNSDTLPIILSILFKKLYRIFFLLCQKLHSEGR